MHALRFVTILLLVSTSVAQQHRRFVFQEARARDSFGLAVAGVGDTNRDGVPDLLVGAPGDDVGGRDAGAAVVYSGRDGRQLRRLQGATSGGSFGFTVAGVGDLNADGNADYAVASPDDGPGVVRVFSGRDGRVLYTWRGDSLGDRFGFSVAGVGDVDRDGRADVLVGAPADDNRGTSSGHARLFSGRNGAQLWRMDGWAAGDNLGNAVAGVGDLDRDGHADLLIAAYLSDSRARDAGRIVVVSGRTKRVLYAIRGNSQGDAFGNAVAGIGDVTRDGVADFAVAAFHDDDGGQQAGSVRVYSGANGKVVFHWDGGSPHDEFGAALAPAGDVDGDGTPDVLVGASRESNQGKDSGAARVYSGRDGVLIRLWNGRRPGDGLGTAVAAAGDVDQDGVGDLIFGAPFSDSGGADSGSALVFTGRRQSLAADTHWASMRGNGIQRLSLDAGIAQRGRIYFLLGSLSGIRPGIRLGPGTLPLNPDAYWRFTLAFPNSLMLQGSVGLLGPRGHAEARIAALSVLPRFLVGRRLDHAFLVLGARGVSFVSNPVPLVLRN